MAGRRAAGAARHLTLSVAGDAMSDMVILRRPEQAREAPGPRVLDAQQQAAADHRGPLLRVLGAPGTGKSTVAVEVVVSRVCDGSVRPDQVLLLAPTRLAAARLRAEVTARIGGTTTTPLARTMSSYAFGLLRADAALRGDPPPRLISGPEQDVILRDLLAGHADGSSPAPRWPESVHPALGTRGFRAELRDLLTVAIEYGLEAGDLARLGVEHGRPEWSAAATVFAEYDAVSALAAPHAYDPSWILRSARDLLDDDADALDRVMAQVGLIVVDDAQDLTPAGIELLQRLVAHQPPVVLIGDPDVSVQTFRGADPRWIARGWNVGGWSALGEGETITLATSHRMPDAVAAAVRRVAGHIGVVGEQAHRQLAATARAGQAGARVLRSAAQEASFIAAEFRRAHLLDGVPWSQMAVIVRGGARTATLRRVLAAESVPVAADGSSVAVREESAVRPLLSLMEAAVAIAAGERDAIEPEAAVDLVLSPIGGADPISLRRLRRALRQSELADGGGRSSDELLAEAIRHPLLLAELGPESVPARRVASALAAGIAAAELDDANAETVLWAIWSATGLSRTWRDQALAGGVAGARRDRDLDAVLALFDAAGRLVDRLPGRGPEAFLEHIRGQEVAGDTLVVGAPVGEAVSVLTAAAAAGRQRRFVVVAGVQEGVWPDLRLRGSLLGSTQLADLLTGRSGDHTDWRAAQAQVRHDETRMFLVAISRASERLLVTAVRSDDELPSPYLDIVEPWTPEQDTDLIRPFTEVPRNLTLPAMVAGLRRDLVHADPARRGRAVTLLARLARAGVPGADPAHWWVLAGLSDDRPLRAPEASVRVSPSSIESFGTCGLKWLLTSRGGEKPSVGSRDVGVLIHEIAAEFPDDTPVAELRRALDERWGRLGLPPSWVSTRKQQQGHAMVGRLAAYYAQAAAEGWRRLAVESAMRVELGRATLAGRIDRLEVRDPASPGEVGQVRVIDHKTGSSKPSSADLERHPQLGAYQLALTHGAFDTEGAAGPTNAGAALLQLGKAANAGVTVQEQTPLADDDDPAWAQELVAATAEGMAGSAVQATVGKHCDVCPVKASCPAQPEGRWLA